jgi:alanyl-tRNA synthetase
VVVAVNEAGQAQGLKAGELVREIARALGGGGGGRDDLAQGGGTDAAALAAVVRDFPSRVGRRVTGQ